MLAGILSALCLWFSWRAWRRCRAIHDGLVAVSGDPLERRLGERELNAELNGAGRTVKALGRAALFGGTGLAVWAAASGAWSTHPIALWRAFGLGLVGWGGCREFHRRIGSLAESWREKKNRERRRQGVDQSAGTG